jgi:hypothetical protein
MQARLDEGAGTLEPIRRNIGQEWAGQPPAGEVRHLPQGIQRRIADDVRVRPPLTSSGVGQNLAVAAILLHAMSEPSTTEGRRIQGELKNLLEDVAVRRAESSASRRQGYPSELGMAAGRILFGYTNTRPEIVPETSTNIHTHQANRARNCTRTRAHRVSTRYRVSSGYVVVD